MNAALSLAPWVMPEQMILPIAISLVVIGLFFRLIGFRRIGVSITITAASLLLIPVLIGPLLEIAFSQIPMWVVVLILVALGFAFVRLLLAIFIGKEGAGTLLAMAVAGALKKMSCLPGLVSKGMKGLSGMLNSQSRAKQIVGLALAILLAILAGLTGRQLQNNGLLPWGSFAENGSSQRASIIRHPPDERLLNNSQYFPNAR